MTKCTASVARPWPHDDCRSWNEISHGPRLRLMSPLPRTSSVTWSAMTNCPQFCWAIFVAAFCVSGIQVLGSADEPSHLCISHKQHQAVGVTRIQPAHCHTIGHDRNGKQVHHTAIVAQRPTCHAWPSAEKWRRHGLFSAGTARPRAHVGSSAIPAGQENESRGHHPSNFMVGPPRTRSGRQSLRERSPRYRSADPPG